MNGLYNLAEIQEAGKGSGMLQKKQQQQDLAIGSETE